MTLIRKVLVMSLKSQTDEHFLAATEEDHPPTHTLKLPEGIDPSAFTAHGHTRSHKQDPARVWSDHSHILSSIPSSMSTASMSLLPCLLISLSPWCLFADSFSFLHLQFCSGAECTHTVKQHRNSTRLATPQPLSPAPRDNLSTFSL